MLKIKLISLIVGLLAIITGVTITVVVVVNKNKNKNKDYRSVKVFKINGKANVIRNDSTLDAKLDMTLKNDDTLTTFEGAEAILKLDDDKFISVKENTTLHLKATGKKNNTKTRIIVEDGGIVVEVKEKLKPSEVFEVATSNSVIAIRGTIFGVNLNKTNEGNIASYKLIKGSIDLNVIELKDNTYNLSNIKVNPMEEIAITSVGSGIIDNTDLTNALDNIDKNTNVTRINLDKTSDFNSITGNISLNGNELTLWDIVEELGLVVDNYEEGVKRVVAQNASFEVIDTEIKDDVVYESENTYRIRLKAYKRVDQGVFSWMVNGKVVEGSDTLELEITRSTLVYPIYEAGYTVKLNEECNNYLYCNGKLVTDGECFARPGDKLKLTMDDSVVMLAYMEVDGNNEVIKSTSYEYTIEPKENMTLKVLFVDLSDGYEEIKVFDQEEEIDLEHLYTLDIDNVNMDNLVFTLKGIKIPHELIDYGVENGMIRFSLATDSFIRTPTYDVTVLEFDLYINLFQYESNQDITVYATYKGFQRQAVIDADHYSYEAQGISQIELEAYSSIDGDKFIGWFYGLDEAYYQFSNEPKTTYTYRKTGIEEDLTFLVPIFESALIGQSPSEGYFSIEYDDEEKRIYAMNTYEYELNISSDEPFEFIYPDNYSASISFYNLEHSTAYIFDNKYCTKSLQFIYDVGDVITPVDDNIIDPAMQSEGYYQMVYTYTLSDGTEYNCDFDIYLIKD